MKVKIIANPNVNGGGMVLVDGEMLPGVQSVDIHLSAGKLPIAVLTMINCDIDIECDAVTREEYQRNPCGH